jgi:hypothetical protein
MPVASRHGHPPDIESHQALERKEPDTMFPPDQYVDPAPVAPDTIPTRGGGCLVDGCSCRDARLVSQRRAAFFAAVARRNGETADRIVFADPAWRMPVDLTRDLDAWSASVL